MSSIDPKKLDQDHVYVAFSQGSSLVARIIRWFTRSQFSHTFTLFYSTEFQIWVALGADARGWMLTPASEENILAAISLKKNLWTGLAKNAHWLGCAYDYTGLLGMSVVEFCWHWLRRKVRNPINGKNTWFCSEIETKIIEDSGVQLKLAPGSVDPQALFDRLMSVQLEPEIQEQQIR